MVVHDAGNVKRLQYGRVLTDYSSPTRMMMIAPYATLGFHACICMHLVRLLHVDPLSRRLPSASSRLIISPASNPPFLTRTIPFPLPSIPPSPRPHHHHTPLKPYSTQAHPSETTVPSRNAARPASLIMRFYLRSCGSSLSVSCLLRKGQEKENSY